MKKNARGAGEKYPRRQWPFYGTLKAKLKGAHKLDFIAVGAGLDTAKDAPPLIELFTFLIDQPDLKIFTDSPRALRAVTRRVSTFSFTSYQGGGLPLTIHIGCERLCCTIRESSGKAWLSEKEKEWKTDEVSFVPGGRMVSSRQASRKLS